MLTTRGHRPKTHKNPAPMSPPACYVVCFTTLQYTTTRVIHIRTNSRVLPPVNVNPTGIGVLRGGSAHNTTACRTWSSVSPNILAALLEPIFRASLPSSNRFGSQSPFKYASKKSVVAGVLILSLIGVSACLQTGSGL